MHLVNTVKYLLLVNGMDIFVLQGYGQFLLSSSFLCVSISSKVHTVLVIKK